MPPPEPPLPPAELVLPPPPPPAEVIGEKTEFEPVLPVVPAAPLAAAPAPTVTGYEPGEAETGKLLDAARGDAVYGSDDALPSRYPPAPPPPPPPPTPQPPVPPAPPPATTTYATLFDPQALPPQLTEKVPLEVNVCTL